MTHETAEQIRDVLNAQTDVHDAHIISDSAVMFVENINTVGDGKTFHGLRERGWRIGATVDTGATIYITVPIDQ